MRHSRRPLGFTLIEAAVTTAIIAIVAVVAYTSLSRSRPRATLATTTAELQSLIHSARQEALASGQNVAVLVFPDYANGSGKGRFVVYRDGNFDFFSGGAVHFDAYDPSVLAAGTASKVLGTMDLPRDVVVGPDAGMGTGAHLTAPLAGIGVDSFCSFCLASGSRRGAIRFDPRGAATFYGCGATTETPVAVNGGASLSLQSTSPSVSGQRTLVITAVAGAIRVITNG